MHNRHIVNKDNEYVCLVGMPDDKVLTDARFITTACNAHEELVAALRDLVAANNAVHRARTPGVRESPPDYAPLYASIHRAQAVLDRLEKVEED